MSVSENSLAGYQLHLPSFEGPLDVLLQMIERERMEISEVSLVAITGGFIEYIAALSAPEPVLLARFLGVASRLLLLKSRALLPRKGVEAIDEEPDDLVAQLREYQCVKQIAMEFREREQAGMRSHARPLSPSSGPVNVVIVVPPVSHLRRALLRAAARMKSEPEVAQMRLQVTIGEMIGRLRREISMLRSVRFREFLGRSSREETVAAFVALLALWRQGEVQVQQERHFDEIWIEREPDARRAT